MVVLLAQASGNPLGPFASYADLGLAVVVLVLLFAGKLRRESEVRERDERIVKLEATLDQYVDHYQDEVLPALIDATKVCGEVVQLLNKRRN